jgi:dihydrofolate reductase
MIQGRRMGVFAAMSLDGYLATENDGLDFLASVQREDEDYGYMAFASRVVGYVVGRRTFDVVTELCGGDFPHVGRWPIYVVTTKADSMTHVEGVEFGDFDALPAWLGQHVPPTSDDEVVWCDGGGQLIASLSDVIDEWTVSVIPTLLGSGIPMFPSGRPAVDLETTGAMTYDSGLIQLRYTRKG